MKDKWVSVNNKLPACSIDVLCHLKNGMIVVMYISFRTEQWSKAYDVTHWMSLPDPPEDVL